MVYWCNTIDVSQYNRAIERNKYKKMKIEYTVLDEIKSDLFFVLLAVSSLYQFS